MPCHDTRSVSSNPELSWVYRNSELQQQAVVSFYSSYLIVRKQKGHHDATVITIIIVCYNYYSIAIYANNTSGHKVVGDYQNHVGDYH